MRLRIDHRDPEARAALAAKVARWARQDIGAGDPYLLELLNAEALDRLDVALDAREPLCLATAYARYIDARQTVSRLQTRGWLYLYRRLARDRNDVVAWETLCAHIGRWARRDVGAWGEVVVNELVTDTCELVECSFAAAYGEDTFAGFVAGHYRNARRPYWRRAAGALDDDVVAPEEPWTDPYLQAQLTRAVAALRDDERAIVVGRYLEEEDSATLAKRLNITDAAVRVKLYRALRRLRGLMLAVSQN